MIYFINENHQPKQIHVCYQKFKINAMNLRIFVYDLMSFHLLAIKNGH